MATAGMPTESGEGWGRTGSGSELPARRAALAALSRPVAGVHDRRKPLPPALVSKALENEPFEDFPRAAWEYRRLAGEAGDSRERSERAYAEGAEAFLRRSFPGLGFLPASAFTLGSGSRSAEGRAVRQAEKTARTAGLAGQAGHLRAAYDGLAALRTLFREACPEGGSPAETVVPARYLGELLFAAPVWFIGAKEPDAGGERGADSATLRYFADLGGSDRFAHLFQLYNSRPRPLGEFAGPDPMPLELIRLIQRLKNRFDFLVIATPYHGLASAEWGKPFWPPGIDPFLFGFLRHLPERMFFLGRWSATGLFPLIPEMMADTAAHLAAHREQIARITGAAFPWYRSECGYGENREETVVGPRLRPLKDYSVPKAGMPRGRAELKQWKVDNHSLVRFTGRLLAQFEAGRAFPWLRGEHA